MTIAPASGTTPDTLTTVEVDARRANVDADELLRCAVCAHALDEHDSISSRYCRATQAQALPRGCICTSI